MTLRTMLAVLTALAVTSCSAVEVRPVPNSPTTTTSAKSALPPLDVATEAAWTSDVGTELRLRDGTALAVGDDAFQVIDTGTGDVRWSVNSGTEIAGGKWDDYVGAPFLVGEGRNLAVLTAYYRLGEDNEFGLALLSAEDGRELWHTSTGEGLRLRTADDRIALVTVTEGASPSEVARLDDLKMIAYDVRTGDKAWERTGAWPTAIAGDTVFGVRALEDDAWESSLNSTAVAVAFDAKTGEPRWDLEDRYEASEVVLAVGDVVVVHTTRSKEPVATLVALSAESGEHVADIGEAPKAYCETDGEIIVACTPNGRSISVFQVDGKKVTQLSVDGALDTVGRDRLFVDGLNHYSVDLAGVTVDQSLPGKPVLVTDDYLVVDPHSDQGSFAGYPLR